ncbi:bifunctional diguanylate cyclase/phosphodiesterase [Shimia sp. R11_0]|uniref:putative bifunctional diguanylate cyclase/phosphodiesterase n=1 Tax=Shimia sp. R11_0 TaxID=2821096 RepID=UPI001ADD0CC2|nr:bifunctional diguanylate cyclase/phosphodiesterase [Shimia sp. R11_0]MBO9478761.1 bifunctional diguanylate cyclase/phosphodiesterase [Shimia sp. R11_0]
MQSRLDSLLSSLRAFWTRETALRRALPVLIPAICLGAWYAFGEVGLLICVFFLPLPLLVAASVFSGGKRRIRAEIDGLTGLLTPAGFEHRMQEKMGTLDEDGQTTACFSLKIDNFARLRENHGDQAAEEVLRYVADRLKSALRTGDLVARAGDAAFTVALEPVSHFDVDSGVQMATRFQTALEEPIPLQMASIYVSCSVGFCLSSRLNRPSATAMIQAADMAMHEAQLTGDSNIRAYSTDMGRKVISRRKTQSEAARTLQRDQIRAWFQPQVSTDTGLVTGFEALARWEHPERGILAPIQFLDVLHQTGQMGQLADLMLRQSLDAVRAWDDAGFKVPMVGVNFAGEELRSPTLVERIQWELDRTELDASRLGIEVLESVVAGTPDDMVVRNVEAISALGCSIDLDDFGTGHASISSIRRLPVKRIKIDRSFVTNIDRDPEQQRMIAAIVTMAERLGLETLAEGVENPSEHTMLAQLGCSHVQGFGIARPMPFHETLKWMTAHQEKIGPALKIGNKPS